MKACFHHRDDPMLQKLLYRTSDTSVMMKAYGDGTHGDK